MYSYAHKDGILGQGTACGLFFAGDVRRQGSCAHMLKGRQTKDEMNLACREIMTSEECKEALQKLSDDDMSRLKQLAKLRVIGLHAVDWQDLWHEAIVRFLNGSRRWPRGVPLVVFLRETMRSIASGHWRRLEMSVVVADADISADSETGDSPIDSEPDMSMDPESRTSAAETLSRIEDIFCDDADALSVMTGMASGQSPREIQEENAMNEKRYASTQRRIRRGLFRNFHDDGEL